MIATNVRFDRGARLPAFAILLRGIPNLEVRQLRRLMTDRGLVEVRSWQSKPKTAGTNQSPWNNIIARQPS
jgi:hypothetical protein